MFLCLVFWTALTTVLLNFVWSIVKHRSFRAILEQVDPSILEELPSVSIVIPVRNEEKELERALQSVLNLDYPQLSITVVNDRSTDGTSEILKKLQKQNTKLRVVTNKSLPEGWLGKVWAMKVGSEACQSEYILFTDADVRYHPDALKRAMTYLVRERRTSNQKTVTQLCILPKIDLKGRLESWVFSAFFMLLFLGLRLWEANRPYAKAPVGAGAFNLVEASFLREHQLLEKLRMEVVEDLSLGYLVRELGGVARAMQSDSMIEVRYQEGIWGLVRGTEKNFFAGFSYSYLQAIASLFLIWIALISALPVAVETSLGPWLVVTCLAAMVFLYRNSLSWIQGQDIVGIPVGIFFFSIALIRSMVLFLMNDGIDWRDTHYSSQSLKAGRVLPSPWDRLKKQWNAIARWDEPRL